jgi:hypothetical protein
MKKICFRFLILFALLSLLAACEEESGIYYVSFEADGTPVILTEGAVPSVTTYEQAYGYKTKSGFTVGASEEGNSNHVIRLFFQGETTGTYGDPDCSCVYYTDYPDTYYASEFYLAHDLTITVTELGEVGGVISGTFSGTLEDVADTEMIITNGEFRVLREVDP